MTFSTKWPNRLPLTSASTLLAKSQYWVNLWPSGPLEPGASSRILEKSGHGGAAKNKINMSPAGSCSVMTRATSTGSSLRKSPRCMAEGWRAWSTARQSVSISQERCSEMPWLNPWRAMAEVPMPSKQLNRMILVAMGWKLPNSAIQDLLGGRCGSPGERGTSWPQSPSCPYLDFLAQSEDQESLDHVFRPSACWEACRSGVLS